jgi:hypothetical protein
MTKLNTFVEILIEKSLTETITKVVEHTPVGPLVYWLKPGQSIDVILAVRS